MNYSFLAKAEECRPVLSATDRQVACGKLLREGERGVLDFGTHVTGYATIRLHAVGAPPDAPALLRVRFCERAGEMDEDISSYHGWIGKGWIQEEIIRLDVFPAVHVFQRRYAFRYICVDVLSLSQKYAVVLENATAHCVTSAPEQIPLCGGTEEERAIDAVALRTLSECMQYEFEDGPKRDRRLWLGDLRLQALANYETFGHNSLVKRCLYLFAGTADADGRLSQCVFTVPSPVPDDASMYDYSLLFIPTLLDYYAATGDRETAEELLPLAKRQILLASERFGNGVMRDSDRLGWCFLDWSLELNKQAGAQAVYIYAEKALADLAEMLGENVSAYRTDAEKKSSAALNAFYDQGSGLFVSGEGRQISYATNVWCVLAGILPKEENARLLGRLRERKDAVQPVTPYMMHHYVQALADSGLMEEARETMRSYWGGMVRAGADTFWELYDPEDPEASPYGGKAVNSYCHAWSCTPAYFLRKYFH